MKVFNPCIHPTDTGNSTRGDCTIVHVTTEVAPFYKRGGLGDVLAALPRYLVNDSYHNIVISVFYDEHMNHLENASRQLLSFEYQGLPYFFQVYYLLRAGIDYYFIQLEDSCVLSDLENTDGTRPYSAVSSLVPYFYFARAVLRVIHHYGLFPRFLFCHEWQTAGIFGYPGLLSELRRCHPLTTIFMIHNYEFHGNIYADIYPYLERAVHAEIEETAQCYGTASFLALALKNSDHVGTVSHSYARELIHYRALHPGLKLLDLCRRRVHPFLNGVDENLWSPVNNPFLPFSYQADRLENKKKIKGMILKELGFTNAEDLESPLVIMLCRLTFQKGIGLFIDFPRPYNDPGMVEYMRNFLAPASRFIIFGTPGNGIGSIIDRRLHFLQKQFPGRFLYISRFREKSVHRLLAAADILLAPSLFEPCGLIQVYAMAFGAVPVVRAIGGMKDTVCCYFQDPGQATGFHMHGLTRQSLLKTMKEVVNLYRHAPGAWQEIIRRGMTRDFSWDKMKNQYFQFFRELTHRKMVIGP